MEPKIYRPTIAEFADFGRFIRKIEKEDHAHKAGLAKIIAPPEWIPRKQGYNIEDLKCTIDKPIKQKFVNDYSSQQHGGVFQTCSSMMSKIKIEDYYKMATSDEFKPPKHTDYQDLERKYWKSLAYNPPIYGCDVANTVSDSDLKIWNLANLDSILNEELDTVIKGTYVDFQTLFPCLMV